MQHDKSRYQADLSDLSEAGSKLSEARQADEDSGMGHHGASVREVMHKGRKIRVETTYHITVDGVPVLGHVMVGHDGRVHYHSIPNQAFGSAVDMVKRIVGLVPSGYAFQDEER